MLKLSANLSFLFPELPFLERFAAASKAGFQGVEFMFPYEYDADQLLARLQAHDLELVLFNLPAGDWASGERGIAALPGRELEFRAGVERAGQLAKKLGARRLNALAGLHPTDVDGAAMTATLVANLRWAADFLAPLGITLLAEPINSRIDMPRFWLDTSEKAVDLLAQVAHDNFCLQFDVYHMAVMAQQPGGEICLLDELLPTVAHIQIADHPGRHQPGTGEIDFGAVFDLLDRRGYAGWIGCEYRPQGETTDSLRWAHQKGLLRSAT